MARIAPNGEIMLEDGDLLPREIAIRDDDPPEVRQLIEDLNPTIETAEDLAKAIAQVDTMRRELASKANEDNPHLEAEDEAEALESKPEIEDLGKNNVKGSAEK